MTNSKPVTDNEEKQKAKKKKDALEVHLANLKRLRIEDIELSGEDIAVHADALAAAKVAIKAIESTVEEGELILKAAMLRHYCDHYAAKGHPPDLRRTIGKLGSCQVVQQQTAKVTTTKAEELKSKGVDLVKHKEKTSYSIRMGKISKKTTKELIKALHEILGEDYDDIVSEYVHVGKKFFGEFDDVIKQSLTGDESLDEKMLSVLRVLNPTVQLSNFQCTLEVAQGFDTALEFAQISESKKKAMKQAEEAAKQSRSGAVGSETE